MLQNYAFPSIFLSPVSLMLERKMTRDFRAMCFTIAKHFNSLPDRYGGSNYRLFVVYKVGLIDILSLVVAGY